VEWLDARLDRSQRCAVVCSRHHSGPEFEASVGPAPPPAGPVHIIHAGAHSTLPGYENATPLYEADIRPGQSLVMPGFTISIEAARGPQQAAADGPAPVVTVTPAGEVGYRATVGNQDPSPRHPQDQHHYQQQQQQPMSEYHPLAGVMRGQQTRQQFDADQAVYREPERQTARLAEQQDWPVKTVPHQHPTSLPHPAHHPGAVRYGNQPVAAEAVARQSEGELVDQQRAWTDSRVWGPHHGQMMAPHHGQVMAGSERQATFIETRPAIDNVQVSLIDSRSRIQFIVLLPIVILFFLPRDAMRKRGICCRPVSVRLSVRLSRSCVVSRRLKISSSFFFSTVAPSLYFLTVSAGTKFQGEPGQRVHKIHGVGGKICDFRLKLPFISETVRHWP